jgi:hypothetical protein
MCPIFSDGISDIYHPVSLTLDIALETGIGYLGIL